MTDAMFDLSGRVALVTGGSRGLGREMAMVFAQHGADVVIASRKLESCKATADEIRSTTGQKALAHACNVSNWDEMEPLADAAYNEFGKVDILVNNAGMSPLYDRVVNVTEALYDKVMGVNLKGPFRLTAIVATRMKEGDGGSIINVSSVAAIRPSPDVIPYAAAKAGLEAMTIAFSKGFGPKVRVNCIEAGPFLTDISKAWDLEAFNKAAEERIPMRRGGQPNEIAGAALYLASDASSFTTGAILRVDGGQA